ncbi:hypothetical protein PB2503_00210 [Parvularcula bermudensis HTCC2503]|uniref:CopC domain-containing protein n=1 Tax=Parvularcula bermudensis (strain ATCC BAA-594 / HTCC2503 / KCTC 12087) TaxID=314260 RepID=E0TI00_PARBH|nr:copper resistance CopC family protein [Parvularcula bermudensis]ADM10811.1 hypothetical protein PB2503_00210 [Parvularcula bermudensis HTCC2503]
MSVTKAFLAVVLSAAFLVLGQAFAHVTIKASSIEDGATLRVAPDEFSFSYSADVRLVGITLSGPESEDEALSFAPDSGFASAYQASLPELGPGSYLIEWRAMAKDGHVMQGSISFDIVD